MKRNFIYVLFSLAFLLSCSDENLPSNGLPSSEPLAKVQNTNRIDVQEATNLAEEAIAFLDSEHPSESKSSRTVNSVSILRFGNLKSSMMKSGEYSEALDISDTLAYVFNFEDSSGFVIISKDKRIESPLLAFTQKGSLVNGETDNPGLKLFLERLEGYMLESIAKYGKSDEERGIVVAQKPYPSAFLDIVVEPLVTVEWDQKKPFNNNLEYKGCTNTGNGNVLAGCAATAVAQIMSYWEYPSSLGGPSYNWYSLKKYKRGRDFEPSPMDDDFDTFIKTRARNQVADLFERIGDGVIMDYSNGCKGSYTTSGNPLGFLKSKGFILYITYADYGLSLVTTPLITGKPILAEGCDAIITKECHLWVIDGLAKRLNNSNYYNYYIHNNWGWGDNSNGYYLSGVFDPSYNYQNVKVSALYK
ncbi:MAG: C10 family peptidase [Fibromonadaceae bacterium]|jgi:hypothetical protein|nr:C10 family peptidase [Fibromonadaceae bacterium]